MYIVFSRESDDDNKKLLLCFLEMTAPQWQNLEQREAYQRLIETVAVLHRLATRLSSRAEIVGAVRQVQFTNTHMQDDLMTEKVNAAFLSFERYCLLQDV